MRKKYPQETYKKEYEDAIKKREQRLLVYKDYCVGDPVYINNFAEAIIWKKQDSYIEFIFKESYHNRITHEDYFDSEVSRRYDE